MNNAEKAQYLIKVSDDLFDGRINDEEVNTAYRLIPNLSDFEFGIQRKMIAIKRYVTFNRLELLYDVNNSDITINAVEEQIFKMQTPIPEDMPTTLINEQTGEKELAQGEYVLPQPAEKPKHPGGRPTGSKNKAKGKGRKR